MSDIIKYNSDFENIIAIIEQSKARAIKAVNAEMIEMYWQIGKYISEKAMNNGWGKSVSLKDKLTVCFMSELCCQLQRVRN